MWWWLWYLLSRYSTNTIVRWKGVLDNTTIKPVSRLIAWQEKPVRESRHCYCLLPLSFLLRPFLFSAPLYCTRSTAISASVFFFTVPLLSVSNAYVSSCIIVTCSCYGIRVETSIASFVAYTFMHVLCSLPFSVHFAFFLFINGLHKSHSIMPCWWNCSTCTRAMMLVWWRTARARPFVRPTTTYEAVCANLAGPPSLFLVYGVHIPSVSETRPLGLRLHRPDETRFAY